MYIFIDRYYTYKYGCIYLNMLYIYYLIYIAYILYMYKLLLFCQDI